MTKDEIKKEVIERYAGRGLIISGGSDYHAEGKKGVKNPGKLESVELPERFHEI